MKIRIATRKSPLARAQAQEVAHKLQSYWPELEYEFLLITTSGDRFTDRPLADIGGKGLFTKEIEEALLSHEADIAVHSMKDVATELPQGLIIPCLLEREDPRDRIVGPGIECLEDIPQGASFGTSSLRRAAQLKYLRPDIEILPLRGNVQTRLHKIAQGEVRATMLANAGLNRLGLSDVEGVSLDVRVFLPAVAQGAIGIECRQNDESIIALLKPLRHEETELTIACERAFLRALDGSCRTPIAAYAQVDAKSAIYFRGLLLSHDGKTLKRCEGRYSAAEAEAQAYEAGLKLKGNL